MQQPLNADYAFRAATAAMAAGGRRTSRESATLLDRAMQGDPMDTQYYLSAGAVRC